MLDQGYGIMPNSVLYNKDLTDKQKLLFCTISSLCAEKGYCRATNETIGELLNADKSTISRNVSVLEAKWFITLEIDQNYKRKITLGKNAQGGTQKCVGGDTQKWVDNITINNNTKENSQFETFWNLYPKKVKKKTAMQKFNNLSQTKQKLAIEAIQKFKTTDQRVRGFIPDPTTYINQERREDEIETKKQERPSTLIFH